MTLGYSSGETLTPNCNTRGRMVAPEAPPYSRAEIKEGRTLYDANSGGKDEADSRKVLTPHQPLGIVENKMETHFNSWFFSASLARAKLSSPAQTLTRRLLKKNPVSAMPISRNPLAVNLPLLLGFKSLLK